MPKGDNDIKDMLTDIMDTLQNYEKRFNKIDHTLEEIEYVKGRLDDLHGDFISQSQTVVNYQKEFQKDFIQTEKKVSVIETTVYKHKSVINSLEQNYQKMCINVAQCPYCNGYKPDDYSFPDYIG